MKFFILKLSLFSLSVLIGFMLFLMQADERTDPYYLKFTQVRQSNLIVGSSKAAQGILPNILDKKLNKTFFNYAFTRTHSPYGQIYFESIKKKLNLKAKNSIFILCIDPWSIASKTKNPNDTLNFREVNHFLDNTNNVNVNPNFQYLLSEYYGRYYKLFFKSKKMLVHKNGWLELSVDLDSLMVKKRTEEKIEELKQEAKDFHFSKLRFKYLLKTIDFLKKHGDVFLVRLPVCPQIRKIEDSFIPDFNIKIEEAVAQSDAFLDLVSVSNQMHYLDGDHLHKKSGKIISIKIANWIISEKNKINVRNNRSFLKNKGDK